MNQAPKGRVRAGPASAPRILVVEDESDLAVLLSYNLEAEGYTSLMLATDGVYGDPSKPTARLGILGVDAIVSQTVAAINAAVSPIDAGRPAALPDCLCAGGPVARVAPRRRSEMVANRRGGFGMAS
jgi:hypothetical protein